MKNSLQLTVELDKYLFKEISIIQKRIKKFKSHNSLTSWIKQD